MISKKEVEHVAKLARLGLNEEEIKKMQKELTLILDYFDLLKEVNVSRVTPTSHPILLENVYREDEIEEEDSQIVLKLLKAAPSKQNDYLKVKGVFG